MVRFAFVCFTALPLIVLAGCEDQPADTPTADSAKPAATTTNHPAAQVATDYLGAAVRGDTQAAIALYTPLAAERMKQFPLPGIEDYEFEITAVDQPADDRALVECRATTTAPSGERVNEVLCLLLQRIEGDWRISGMAFNPDPAKPPMVFNFETPDRGAIPLQVWVAEANGQTTTTRPSPPRTADEPAPTGIYR